MEIKGNPMLRLLKPIENPLKLKNKNKYYAYHKDYGHATFECCELKKALHKLVDHGQLNRFLRRGRGKDRNYRDLEGKKKTTMLTAT